MFPVGEQIANGRWTITDEISGRLDRGMYRALGNGRALVSTSAPQTSPHAALRERFGYAVDGIAPLLEITTATLEGVDYDALFEREPTGEPVTRRRPTDPRAFGRELASIVARAHAAGCVLGGIRPELVYTDGTHCTGIAPRAEPFHAGGGERCYGVAPCFEHVYLSPEAIALRPVVAASDVFSMCATLVYVFDGEPPFSGNLIAQFGAAMRGELRATSAPPEVRTGIQADAARRPSALDLAAALV